MLNEEQSIHSKYNGMRVMDYTLHAVRVNDYYDYEWSPSISVHVCYNPSYHDHHIHHYIHHFDTDCHLHVQCEFSSHSFPEWLKVKNTPSTTGLILEVKRQSEGVDEDNATLQNYHH